MYIYLFVLSFTKIKSKQECIPSAEGRGESASVHDGIPPWPDPSTSPLGMDLKTPPGQTPQPPPLDMGLETPHSDPSTSPNWVWAWRPPATHNFLPGYGPGDPPATLNFPPGYGLETPPPARPLNFPPGYGAGDPPPWTE